MNSSKKMNKTTQNLLLDAIILVGLLVSFAPPLTGLMLHEWLSLAFGLTLTIHVLLHWEWIAAVTRRFFRATSWTSRINYILGLALFIAFNVIIFSGVMESRYFLSTFGLSASSAPVWKFLHKTSADLTLWLAGLHIALHWRWISNAVKRIFRSRQPAPSAAQTPAAVPVLNNHPTVR